MSWETATILIGGFGTLAVFSFLIKENALYRFFEHLFIGIAAGFGLVGGLKDALYPQVLIPLLGLDIDVYPDGTLSAPYDYRNLFYLIPMAFGLLYYCIYSVRYGWLAKLVIGFTLGISGGIMFDGFFSEMIPQIVGSFKPLVVFTGAGDERAIAWGASLSNTIFVTTLLLVMYYFFFSFKRGAWGSSAARGGRWCMMICFGAFFGSTVMARMALLVERLQFLLTDWWRAIVSLF
jgi:hypothetical protein